MTVRLTVLRGNPTIGRLPPSFPKQAAVVPRKLTAGLLAVLAVLGVTFTVLMGFYVLVDQLQDVLFSQTLLWAGRVCFLLLVISFVLLVVSLAIDAVVRRDEAERE